MRIFIDMDGTLAKWNNVDTFEDLYEKDYYFNLKPQTEVVNAINDLIKKNEDIYILSAYLSDSKYALNEKKLWLKRFLPQLNEDKYIFVKFGDNKSDYIKNGIGKDDILLDDYTKNLIDWRDNGGTGIKLLNGINNTKNTWNGVDLYYQEITATVLKESAMHLQFNELKETNDYNILKNNLIESDLFYIEKDLDLYLNTDLYPNIKFDVTQAMAWYEGLTSTDDLISDINCNQIPIVLNNNTYLSNISKEYISNFEKYVLRVDGHYDFKLIIYDGSRNRVFAISEENEAFPIDQKLSQLECKKIEEAFMIIKENEQQNSKDVKDNENNFEIEL